MVEQQVHLMQQQMQQQMQTMDDMKQLVQENDNLKQQFANWSRQPPTATQKDMMDLQRQMAASRSVMRARTRSRQLT